MKRKRTRKQKQNPHYQFLVSWPPKAASQARVKRELELTDKTGQAQATPIKKANILAKDTPSASLKKDIARSLLLASFILLTELVLYLAVPRWLSGLP